MATTALPMPTAPMTDVTSMLSSVPADLFSSAPEAPETVAEEAAPEDAPIIEDAPVEDEPAVEAAPEVDPAADVIDEPAAEAAPAEPAAAAGEEELPEGVTHGKDSKGRSKYFLEEGRYKTFHGAHRLVQDAAELLGEPVTMDALQLRNESYLAQERLFSNLTSADPTQQGDVVQFMLNEMKGAHEAGEVGTDPTVPFAQSVYETLKSQAPDAYAHLRMQAAQDFLGEMYELAAKTGDLAVGHSAQHIARALAGIGPKPAEMSEAQYLQQVREVTGRSGIPFYTPEEFQGLARGEDPLVAAQRRIQELESQANGKSNTGGAEQFQTWKRSTAQSVNTAVMDDAVKPVLSSIADSWKNFPEDYNRLVLDPLNREVSKVVRADTALESQIAQLDAKAQRATSEQVRQQIAGQIKQLYVNRAKLAAEKVKGPILKFAAESLAGRSAQTHTRKASAQTRTAPQGQSTPVRSSALPNNMGFKNNQFDTSTAMKQALAVLNGR